MKPKRKRVVRRVKRVKRVKRTGVVNPNQTRILQILLSSWGYVTTNEVASMARMSWNTAKAHLTAMWRKGWINRRVSGRTEYWKAKPPIN